MRPPKEPKTTFTVGTVQGGTSVNAIAGEARLTLDMRSNEEAALLAHVDVLQIVLAGTADGDETGTGRGGHDGRKPCLRACRFGPQHGAKDRRAMADDGTEVSAAACPVSEVVADRQRRVAWRTVVATGGVVVQRQQVFAVGEVVEIELGAPVLVEIVAAQHIHQRVGVLADAAVVVILDTALPSQPRADLGLGQAWQAIGRQAAQAVAGHEFARPLASASSMRT